MKHVFIMDPLSSVKPWKDTSYFLMLAAAERGHEVYFTEQRSLFLRHDSLLARTRRVQVKDDHDNPFNAEAETTTDLSEMDVVWLRTDPPFDRRYFYTTLFLDRLPDSVKVVNTPQGVRDWNEKLAALDFPDLTPQTLVSNNVDDIAAFAGQHDRITIKPIDGFGGKGIFFHTAGDPLDEVTEAVGDRWVIAQEYLPAASEGDKRILLVAGEPIGAILRVHAEGVELNNLDAGGTAEACELDENDQRICAAIKPYLIEKDLFFVGIDVIGGKLIEINVTSPTGLQELSRFSGIPHHHRIIEKLER